MSVNVETSIEYKTNKIQTLLDSLDGERYQNAVLTGIEEAVLEEQNEHGQRKEWQRIFKFQSLRKNEKNKKKKIHQDKY